MDEKISDKVVALPTETYKKRVRKYQLRFYDVYYDSNGNQLQVHGAQQAALMHDDPIWGIISKPAADMFASIEEAYPPKF